MNERDVAIVLSGGGMNGVLLELGFLRRLRESSLWPRVGRIYGTSAGALSGSMAALDRLDADVLTFENCSTGGMDLEAIGSHIKEKKVCIGVVDHHTLQVETPDQVAEMIRRALKHVPAERLVLASDCGMGREGMSRRHAFHKMVSIVLGTNIVRRELGLPEARCLAAEEQFSMVEDR